MDINVRRKLELLAKNRDIIGRKYTLDNGLMSIVGSMILMSADREADLEELKTCSDILKKKTGLFSSFRSISELSVISKMAVSFDPESYITELKAVYDKICKGRFADNSYMILAAMSICDQGRADDADQIIAKFNDLMKRMSKLHPILTSSEDMAFAMLLALTDKSVDQILRDIEEAYIYLKKVRHIKAGSGAIMSLSQVLAITDGDMRIKCDKSINMFNDFAAHGIKYGKESEFASIGALIDLDIDNNVFINEVIEADTMLKNTKGFGSWSLDAKTRLMFAALIVSSVYSSENDSLNGAVIGNTVATVIAEEIATLMVTMMCCSASTCN